MGVSRPTLCSAGSVRRSYQSGTNASTDEWDSHGGAASVLFVVIAEEFDQKSFLLFT